MSKWTPEEDAVLRARYLTDGGKACARELGRDPRSVFKRAHVLRLVRRPRWSPNDDAVLRDNWGELDLRGLSKLLGRTELTIYWRAGLLGLPRGCPQGYEYLSAASDRTGYATVQLRRILRWAGVKVRSTLSRPERVRSRLYRYHCVVPFDVDEALAAWHRTEPIDVAAHRHGTDGATLKRWLREARDAGTEMPSEPRRRSAQWRIPSATTWSIGAERRSSETVRHAARRLGVDPGSLGRWLRESGLIKPPGWVWRLPSKTIDEVVTARRAALGRAA